MPQNPSLKSTARQRGNAPIDPFQRAPLSAGELSEKFNVLRASFVSKSSGPLPAFQHILNEKDAWFSKIDPPEIILFISHRWQSLDHPDPDGETADALRRFLGYLHCLLTASTVPVSDRINLVPSLRVHGLFQAAWLLGNRRGTGEKNEDGWGKFTSRVLGENLADAANFILSKVGIWYDFSCIPQSNARDLHRTPENEKEFTDCLRALHSLVAASTLLLFRKEDDDFGSRAWCVAELAVGQPHRRHIVLRQDRIGREITRNEILGPRESQHETFLEFREKLSEYMDTWPSHDSRILSFHYLFNLAFMGLDEVEELRSTPLFVTPRNPSMVPGQKILLIAMIDLWNMVEQVNRMLPDGRLNIHLDEEILRAMDKAGLHCSEATDRLYAGLLILYSRHVGAPELANFYAECLGRWLNGKNLLLRQFELTRETPFDVKVRYRFDGDRPGFEDASPGETASATFVTRPEFQVGSERKLSDGILAKISKIFSSFRG